MRHTREKGDHQTVKKIDVRKTHSFQVTMNHIQRVEVFEATSGTNTLYKFISRISVSKHNKQLYNMNPIRFGIVL